MRVQRVRTRTLYVHTGWLEIAFRIKRNWSAFSNGFVVIDRYCAWLSILKWRILYRYSAWDDYSIKNYVMFTDHIDLMQIERRASSTSHQTSFILCRTKTKTTVFGSRGCTWRAMISRMYKNLKTFPFNFSDVRPWPWCFSLLWYWLWPRVAGQSQCQDLVSHGGNLLHKIIPVSLISRQPLTSVKVLTDAGITSAGNDHGRARLVNSALMIMRIQEGHGQIRL